MEARKIYVIAIALLLWLVPMSIIATTLPAWYKTTTDLNLRIGPSTTYSKVTTVSKGIELLVWERQPDGWSRVDYEGKTVYARSKYLTYERAYNNPQPKAIPAKKKTGSTSYFSIAVGIVVTLIAINILRRILIVGLYYFSRVAYKLFWIVSIPFFILNWLQRHLSKPWRVFFKCNDGNNSSNESKRKLFEMLKIPIYIVLTPLRFVNAVYYNLIVHVTLEFFNYFLEVLIPSNDKEGEDDNMFLWYLLLPWRVIRYPLFHGTLTIVESVIWTAVDTLIPALTLYHGTDIGASINITQSHIRRKSYDWSNGIWNVGGGNYAGNGIYFAPSRSTALHYSSGSLIIARVSLGKVLDLGLAPYRLYSACGRPNALCVTDWGIKNGYTTGEWWRADASWWEYCMYDWQNKYNESWRIRPIYVLNMEDECIQRIPGGMYHWLFSPIVAKDILWSMGLS